MNIYEDEYTMAFMDIAKDVDGHLLVVPKTHFTNILDCNDEYLINLMRTVKCIANHLVDDCGYDGVNLLNASDESAGQSVFHFHIHVIPRKSGDNIKAWTNFGGAETPTEDIFKKITML
jgi:histidine triad (HIT) family protein